MNLSKKFNLKNLNIKEKIGSFSLVSAVFNIYSLLIMSYLMLYLYNGKIGNATPYKQQEFLRVTLYAAVAFLCAVVIQFVIRKILKQPAMRLKNNISAITTTQIFALGFLLVNFISALLSPYGGLVNSKGQSMVFFGGDAINSSSRCEGLIFTLIYVVIFLLGSVYGKLCNITALVVALTLIAMSGIGLVQQFGWNIFDICYKSLFESGGAAMFVSTIGQFNIYSIAATILLSFCGGCVLLEKRLNIFTRAVCLVAFTMGLTLNLWLDVSAGKLAFAIAMFVVFPYMIAKPATRKGAVSLAIGTVAALWFNKCVISFYPKELTFKYDIDFSLGKKYLFLIFVLIAVRVALQFFNEIIDHKFITPAIYGMALIFGLMTLYYFKNNYISTDEQFNLFNELSALSKGELVATSGTYRLANWYASMEIVKEFPWFGSGPGTFYRAFTDYSLSIYRIYRPGYWVDLAHNDYVQYLATIGIVGIVAYMGFLATILYRAARRAAKNPAIVALVFAVVMFMVQNFFIFSLVATAPTFFVILGLLEREIRNTPVKPLKEILEEWNARRKGLVIVEYDDEYDDYDEDEE